MCVGMKVWRRRSLDESSDMRFIKTTVPFVFQNKCLNNVAKWSNAVITGGFKINIQKMFVFILMF